MKCSKCKMDKGLAGQGFTKYTCEICGQEGFWHNTDIPKICPSCSKNLCLCDKCGKDMLKEAIEKAKNKTNMLDVALDIGISESSLYKYFTEGKAGDKVISKIRKWYYNLNE